MDRELKMIVTAGLLLGFGFSGFVDELVFNSLLLDHGMSRAMLPDDGGLARDRFLDAVFHTSTWLAMVAGVGAFLRAVVRGGAITARSVLGSFLLGAGVFDVIEGLANHHLFGLHRAAAMAGVPDYDWVYLLVGVVLAGCGAFLLHGARAPAAFRDGEATDEPVEHHFQA